MTPSRLPIITNTITARSFSIIFYLKLLDPKVMIDSIKRLKSVSGYQSFELHQNN